MDENVEKEWGTYLSQLFLDGVLGGFIAHLLVPITAGSCERTVKYWLTT